MTYTILMKKDVDPNDFYIDENNVDAHAEMYMAEDDEKHLFLNRWCFGWDFYDRLIPGELDEITPDNVYIIAYDPSNFECVTSYEDEDWEEWEELVNNFIKDGDYTVYYGHI